MMRFMLICIRTRRKVQIHSNPIHILLMTLSLYILDPGVGYYDKSEQISSLIAIWYSCLLSVIIVLPPVLALFITLWHVLILNQRIEDVYLLPVACSVPYEVNNFLKYIGAYIWISICYLFWTTTKLLMAVIQASINFYVIADLKTLQSNASEL